MIATGIRNLPTNVAASLAIAQQSPSTPSTSSSSNSRLPIPELAPQLSRSEFPLVNFWLKETWYELKKQGKVKDEDDDPDQGMSTKTPKPNDKASTTSCYMEDENGEQQPESTKNAARAAARGFWIKLLNEKRAPQTFLGGDLALQNEYISLMEREYPWLRYCENHWKAKQIWHGHYTQWYGPAVKREAARKAKEAAEKAAAEGRVINVDADNDNSREKPSKRPRPDDETTDDPKRRRVEEAKSTPSARPPPTNVTIKRARVCSLTPFSYTLY